MVTCSFFSLCFDSDNLDFTRSLKWNANDRVVSRVVGKWKFYDSSDSNSVALMTPSECKWKPALKASNHEHIFTILEISASKFNPTL